MTDSFRGVRKGKHVPEGWECQTETFVLDEQTLRIHGKFSEQGTVLFRAALGRDQCVRTSLQALFPRLGL